MFEIVQRRRRPRSNRRGGRKRKNRTYPNESSGERISVQPGEHPNHQQATAALSGHRSSCSSSAPASNGDSQLNPLVAKLLRGESLPTSPQSASLIRRFSEARGPEHYVEQIQICVANPGRFLASWTLLVTLFGEPKLYDFIRECHWNETELEPFVIKEDY